MSDQKHWTAEKVTGRDGGQWALVYDRLPGGRKNEDGTTTYAMWFPMLRLSEFVADGEKASADIAGVLNSHQALVDAAYRVLDYALLNEQLDDPKKDGNSVFAIRFNDLRALRAALILARGESQ